MELKRKNNLTPHFIVGNILHHLICIIVLSTAAQFLPSIPVSETQIELEAKVKAAYINNFTRFIYWKSEESGNDKEPIIIGVYGNDIIGDILTDYSKKQSCGQSVIIKKFKKKISEVGNCHLLFISHSEQQQLSLVLKELEGTNVLTVSDIPNFAKQGGMIGFYLEQNRIKIEINLNETNKAGLRVSAKLLEVARIINTED